MIFVVLGKKERFFYNVWSVFVIFFVDGCRRIFRLKYTIYCQWKYNFICIIIYDVDGNMFFIFNLEFFTLCKVNMYISQVRYFYLYFCFIRERGLEAVIKGKYFSVSFLVGV